MFVFKSAVDHELLDSALAWARKPAGQPPLAVAEIKRAARWNRTPARP